MASSENTVEADLVIVGGGITGLSAAYLAAKKGKKVKVIEAGSSFGGLLSTFPIGGNRLEFYYHHFFTHDLELNYLIKELGLQDKLFFRKTSMGVFKNGKIYAFNTPGDLFRFSPIRFTDKLRFALTSVYLGKFANWKKYEHVSCSEWFDTWAGKSTSASLWEPLLNIKFGPFAPGVPLSWMVGRLRQRMNSRKNGDERLGYLDGSLQVLLDALLQRLQEMQVELIPRAPVEKIQFANGKVASLLAGGHTHAGKNYLFTIPGIYLSDLVKEELPELSKKLADIRYFGAICVIIELFKPLSNIYWLNVADKGFDFGGIIEHTNFIDSAQYNGSHIAYLSRYFAMEEKIAGMNNEEIKDLMISQLHKIYPDFTLDRVKQVHVFRTQTAATVCDLHFSKKVPDCKTPVSNLFVANMAHVYPDERSTNNSIKIAMEALRSMGMQPDVTEKTNSLSAQIGF
jgi:protoporphyrinogen oxidase